MYFRYADGTKIELVSGRVGGLGVSRTLLGDVDDVLVFSEDSEGFDLVYYFARLH